MFDFLFTKKKCIDKTILILGLDNSGKTTFLNLVKNNTIKHFTPTIQPYSDEIIIGNNVLKIYDFGGHTVSRCLWEEYLNSCDIVIYIIDASDKNRYIENQYELSSILNYTDIKKTPVLIFGNKIDIPHSCSKDELINTMDIKYDIFSGRVYLIMGSVYKNYNVRNCIKWLITR